MALTTTMSGPSRLMAPTTTPDGASPTTPSPLSLTPTRAMLASSALTITSGLRTTTDMMTRTARATVLLLPLLPRMPTNPLAASTDPTATVLTVPLRSREEPARVLPRLATATAWPAPPLTSTLGAVIRTSPSTSLTTRPGPSPTTPSPMTNGTTRTTISGAPRLGVRTETSTVPPPSARLPPTSTGMATAVREPRLPPPRAARPRPSSTSLTATATVDTANNTVATLDNKSLPLTRRPPPPLPRDTVRRTSTTPPAAAPPPAPATTTTSGPSRPTALTTTADGASLTTPLTPSPTTTSNTPARFRPMTTSGPRITTAMTTGTPPDTAAPPPPPLRLPSRRPTASSPSTADGERVLDLMCIRSELAAVRSLSLASDIMFQKLLKIKK